MEEILFILIYLILAIRYLTYFKKKLVEYKQKKWEEVRDAYILLVFKSFMIGFPLIVVSAIVSRLLTLWFNFMMNYIT